MKKLLVLLILAALLAGAGQVTGGVVMGVGLALSEGTQLDDEGRQRNPHLLDYKLITASDAPEIEVFCGLASTVLPRYVTR